MRTSIPCGRTALRRRGKWITGFSNLHVRYDVNAQSVPKVLRAHAKIDHHMRAQMHCLHDYSDEEVGSPRQLPESPGMVLGNRLVQPGSLRGVIDGFSTYAGKCAHVFRFEALWFGIIHAFCFPERGRGSDAPKRRTEYAGRTSGGFDSTNVHEYTERQSADLQAGPLCVSGGIIFDPSRCIRSRAACICRTRRGLPGNAIWLRRRWAMYGR